MTFQFKPLKEIRDFDCKDLIDKTVSIKLGYLSTDKKKQYAFVDLKAPLGSIHDWIPTQGGKETIIERNIKDAYLMEHRNGGRGDFRHYTSYQDYFNMAKKEDVLKFWGGGFFAGIGTGSGNVDECDLVLEFEGFKIEDQVYDLVAPEEWYSEMHWDSFKFKKGFYENADKAIHFFSDRPHEDLFGEYYFPVIVFPKNTKVDVRSIAYGAKDRSKPIVTAKHIVFGLRCKSSEYVGVINETYKNRGRVARLKEWDWD